LTTQVSAQASTQAEMKEQDRTRGIYFVVSSTLSVRFATLF